MLIHAKIWFYESLHKLRQRIYPFVELSMSGLLVAFLLVNKACGSRSYKDSTLEVGGAHEHVMSREVNRALEDKENTKFDPNQTSKRQVKRGSDPIHNRS
ncbi:clavata3-like [Striga asiatica]|uniref:Clavata3-like n=1 Tax=Striga asiatica TaxID=4170 RepID=A0A5A7QI63_STRAF|nr:clavata3-like [Striga asiatica]